MYGHEEIKIVYGDALAANENIKDDSFDVLIANPPYSVKGFLETLTEADLSRFALMARVSDISNNNSIETFFVERAKQLLTKNGVAAIILPSSILSKGGIYEASREILLQYFYIVAIAAFGSGAFGKTGTNTVTLFIRRRDSNPEAAKHYKNRVESWFNADHKKDIIFADNEIIDKYCALCKLDANQYCEWLLGGETPDAPIFAAYEEAAKNNKKYKDIAKKKITAKYTNEMKSEELLAFVESFIKQKESEKLYYFMLADDNKAPVVIAKSPEESAREKSFLGYEWSGRKGDEGIKYIGANNLLEIKTPLFNPQNLEDEGKLNTIIRHNFEGKEVAVPEELNDFVSVYRLVDLMDFSSVEFDKTIKTSQLRKRAVRDGMTEYKLTDTKRFLIGIGNRVLSSEIVDNGKYPVYSANVNKEFGRIDKLNLDDFSIPSVLWGIDGDWMVNFIPANIPFYPTDHCGYLRILTDEILPQYAALALQVEGEYEHFSRSNRASTQRIKNLTIYAHNQAMQKQIVSEFNDIDAKINLETQTIEKCADDVKVKFDEMFGGIANKKKISDISSLVTKGTTPTTLGYNFVDNGDINFIKVENINDNNEFDFAFTKITKECDEIMARSRLKVNDILFSIAGTLGRVALVTNNILPANTNQALSIIRIKDTEIILPMFLMFALKQNIISQLVSEMKMGSNRQNLSLQNVKDLTIPLPPLSLQKEFAAYVEKSDEKKKAAVRRKEELTLKREELIGKYFK